MSDEKKGKVVSLFDELAKRGRQPPQPMKPAKTLTIRGNHNVGLIGHGNNVTINVSQSAKRAKPAPVLDPGGQHISSEQAGVLANMVRDLHALGVHSQKAWTAFNRRFCIASYRELPAGRFGEADFYLRQCLAKQRGTPRTAEEARKRLMRAIHATKRQRGLDGTFDAFLHMHFGVTGLSQLDQTQLKRALDLVRAVPPVGAED